MNGLDPEEDIQHESKLHYMLMHISNRVIMALLSVTEIDIRRGREKKKFPLLNHHSYMMYLQ